jgi:molecular chaperone Hsp33
LLVQCDHQLNLRAYAKYEDNLTAEDYAHAFLAGKMVLTLSPHKNTQAYQSIVPIQSTSMSENLTQYFAQSEQLATFIWLAVDDSRAAGMMLQLMPAKTNDDLESIEREQFWEYATQIGNTITQEELLNLDNELILHRLYHETELMLFESRSARFRCRCSREKMQQVITTLGEQDAKDLLDEKGNIEVTCDFCNSHFVFDAIDVTLLFK